MVTFVNRFTVTGPPEEFERLFEETSAFFVARPGFLTHRLVRHGDLPGHYVNVAEWEDEESFRAAVTDPAFAPHAAALRKLSTSEPNLYPVTVLERRAA
ncbi:MULTISPECIES: antibiotic biosynthesis monooxygenase family protein [unclassified Streptomyces]|uniref:antibiotic biosynthesis monooxygenase family protein n=1 Tax=unclassified Streptomyces TaxID=2593676 RepID=UPI00344EFAA8